MMCDVQDGEKWKKTECFPAFPRFLRQPKTIPNIVAIFGENLTTIGPKEVVLPQGVNGEKFPIFFLCDS